VSKSEQADAVSFIERFAQSEQFETLFREGMALVEETADYLDGRGRSEARNLKPPLSVIYATESMRLTTRLLEVASWLVVQRALRDGEISEAEADEKRARVKLRSMTRPSHIRQFQDLPDGLRSLIERSFVVTDRLSKIDKMMQSDATDATPLNPVADQMQRLASAFGMGSRATH